MLHLATVFKFEEGTVICTVKVALDTVLMEHWDAYIVDKHNLVRCYLEDNNYEIIEFSSGRHMEGKAGKAHAHIHYVLKYNGTGNPIYSNESTRKKRYLDKLSADSEHPLIKSFGMTPGQFTFTNVSMKWEMLDINSIHYATLAYPLKEGIRCDRTLYSMAEPYIVALQEYAEGVYKGQVAMHERRERSEEKLQCRKEEMLKVARTYRSIYSNWREMACVLQTYYVKPLPFREKPRPQDFKINCQIIAVELGIADYVDFF